MRYSAADYAKVIGKSVSTARRALEAMSRDGKAKRITTYSQYSHRGLSGGYCSGTVRAIEYDIREQA